MIPELRELERNMHTRTRTYAGRYIPMYAYVRRRMMRSVLAARWLLSGNDYRAWRREIGQA